MKKRYFIVLFVLITVFLIVLTIINNYLTSNSRSSVKFTNDVKSKILSYTNNAPLPERINRYLTIINNPKSSDQEKYNALTALEFFFSMQYISSFDPTVRSYVNDTMNNFAKNNLSKYYKKADFNIPCSDPTCGNKIDSKGQEIIDSISNNNQIEPIYKDTILSNLKTTLYLPDVNKQDKASGLNIVVTQLQKLNNNQASKSAKLLIDYFHNRYNL